MKNWSTFLALTISKELAEAIRDSLSNVSGLMIPKNRFVIATIEGDQQLSSGLIIPNSPEDSKPKLGVIVYQKACETMADGSDETYCDYNLEEYDYTGLVATMGIYSGKEVPFGEINEVKEVLEKYNVTNQLTFKVVSAAEVAMVQPNYK